MIELREELFDFYFIREGILFIILYYIINMYDIRVFFLCGFKILKDIFNFLVKDCYIF